MREPYSLELTYDEIHQRGPGALIDVIMRVLTGKGTAQEECFVFSSHIMPPQTLLAVAIANSGKFRLTLEKD